MYERLAGSRDVHIINVTFVLKFTFCRKKVVLSMDEVSDIKKISDFQLRLLGFKSLACLKPYHNLRPPTFIYPDEEVLILYFIGSSVCMEFMAW